MTDRVPEWLEPMAATLTKERFTGPDWVFERKLDGIRLLAFKDGDDVRLLTRNRLSQNAPLSRRRQGDRRAARATTPSSTARRWASGASRRGRLHVFDVLWLDGGDLTALPSTTAACASKASSCNRPSTSSSG